MAGYVEQRAPSCDQACVCEHQRSAACQAPGQGESERTDRLQRTHPANRAPWTEHGSNLPRKLAFMKVWDRVRDGVGGALLTPQETSGAVCLCLGPLHPVQHQAVGEGWSWQPQWFLVCELSSLFRMRGRTPGIQQQRSAACTPLSWCRLPRPP